MAQIKGSPHARMGVCAFQQEGGGKHSCFRGVYSFLIAFHSDGFPPHGYLMYVGETGNKSKETLRSRFLSYFSEMKDQSRSIHYVLLKSKYLHFQFSAVSDKRRNLRKVEESLCDALIPPYNVRDFSAEMRAAKRAF